MTATHNTHCTASNTPVLYLALELGASSWKLAFTVGLGQKPRLKSVTARSTLGLLLEIADRQRIARLLPTAHRAASRFPSRQRIAGLGGGIDASGRLHVPDPAT